MEAVFHLLGKVRDRFGVASAESPLGDHNRVEEREPKSLALVAHQSMRVSLAELNGGPDQP